MRLAAGTLALIVFAIVGRSLAHQHIQTNAQTPVAPPESYVEVTRVTVDPPTIHKAKSPSQATISIQILLSEGAPPDTEAKLEIGTYSSDPPDNTLRFDEQVRKVTLREGLTTVRVGVESAPATAKGKVKVIANVTGATNGVHIRQAQPAENAIVELTVLDP